MITKEGIVTSAKLQGTVTVTVHRHMVHPVYKKRFRQSRKFLADSTGFDLANGDEVRIQECRPISKNKHFRVTEILKQAPRVSELSDGEAVEKVVHREKQKPAAKPAPATGTATKAADDSSSSAA